MSKDHNHLRNIILAGLLASMSIVLKIFLSFTTYELRITFYEIPLFIGGIILGPFLAGIAGFAVDWTYVMVHPFAFTFNLFTLSAMLWGIVPGLVFLKRKVTMSKIAFTIIGLSLLTFILNSVQLYIFSGPGMFAQVPARLLIMGLKWPIQIPVIYIIYEKAVKPTFQMIFAQNQRY
jgi:ECF transporter S component (folate family)